MDNEKRAIRTAYFSILGNIALALIKAVSGVLGNSYALIADAIESTTDIFASLLVLLGLRYAQKPADRNHPYGHGKIEPLVTFVIVAFLVASAILIASESIENIKNPGETPKAWTLIVLAAIIIWKELSFQIVIRNSRKTESSSLKADAWHHRSDAITSLTAFIGIAIAVIFGKGYESADDWAALVASGIILFNSYRIFRPALSEVMDEDLYPDLQQEIRDGAAKVPGVLGTKRCFIRKSGMKYHVNLQVFVDGEILVREGAVIARNIQIELLSKIPVLGDILIRVEPHIDS